VAKSIVCGSDSQKVIAGVREFEAAGFTHVVIHNVGPRQEDFLRWAAEEIVPEFGRQPQAAGVGTRERQLGR
jgi:hypothetical protein